MHTASLGCLLSTWRNDESCAEFFVFAAQMFSARVRPRFSVTHTYTDTQNKAKTMSSHSYQVSFSSHALWEWGVENLGYLSSSTYSTIRLWFLEMDAFLQGDFVFNKSLLVYLFWSKSLPSQWWQVWGCALLHHSCFSTGLTPPRDTVSLFGPPMCTSNKPQSQTDCMYIITSYLSLDKHEWILSHSKERD